jgi:hypothetical protein
VKGETVWIVVCGLDCRVFARKEDAEHYELECRGGGPEVYEAVVE